MARERERLEEQREAEEIQRLKNLFLLDETMKKQKNHIGRASCRARE